MPSRTGPPTRNEHVDLSRYVRTIEARVAALEAQLSVVTAKAEKAEVNLTLLSTVFSRWLNDYEAHYSTHDALRLAAMMDDYKRHEAQSGVPENASTDSSNF